MRYHISLRLMHWAMVILLAWLVYGGWMLDGTGGTRADVFAAYSLHKSVGMVALVLALIRLGCRFMFGGVPQGAGWQGRLARLTHGTLYGLILLYPLSGWALHSAAGFGAPNALLGWQVPNLPVGARRFGQAFIRPACPYLRWFCPCILQGRSPTP